MDYKQLALNIDTERIDWEQSDKQIADALNAITKTVPIDKTINRRDIGRVLTQAEYNGLFNTLKSLASNDEFFLMAYEALADISPTGGLNLNEPAVQKALAGFVSLGKIDQKLMDKIIALSVETVSKYQPVTWQDVAIARKRRVIE